MSKIKPFDILNSICDKSREFTKEEVESNLPYNMLLSYLCSSHVALQLAEYLNKNYSMSMYDKYLLSRAIVPKGLKIKWIKAYKKDDEETLEAIQHFYVCSRKTAIEYFVMLNETELRYIKQFYEFKKGD